MQFRTDLNEKSISILHPQTLGSRKSAKQLPQPFRLTCHDTTTYTEKPNKTVRCGFLRFSTAYPCSSALGVLDFSLPTILLLRSTCFWFRWTKWNIHNRSLSLCRLSAYTTCQRELGTVSAHVKASQCVCEYVLLQFAKPLRILISIVILPFFIPWWWTALSAVRCVRPPCTHTRRLFSVEFKCARADECIYHTVVSTATICAMSLPVTEIYWWAKLYKIFPFVSKFCCLCAIQGTRGGHAAAIHILVP